MARRAERNHKQGSAGEGPPGRRWGLWLVGGVALLARGVVLAQLDAHPLLQPTGGLDSAAYVRLAQRAAAGDWALGPDVYFVSPLYIYFLAFLFRVFGPSLLVPKLVQIVLGAVGTVLVGLTARRLFARESVAVLATALHGLTGAVVFHEVLLLQSALDPFLTALALFLLVSACAGRGFLPFAGAGASAGLLVANRPNALLPFVVVGLVWLLVRRTRRAGLELATLALGAALVLAPFALRNRLVAGEWVLLSSHGGLNFYIGNNPEADGTYRAVPEVTPAIEGQAQDARRVAERAAGRTLSAREVSGHFYDRAFAWIRSAPLAAGTLFLRKVAYVVNAADAPLNYSYAYYARDEPTLLRFLLVGPWMLLPFGALGLFVRPPAVDRVVITTWGAFIPAYALSVAVFFVSARYRLPLMVPLCVTAAAALDRLVGWARLRRWRPLSGALLGLAGLSGATFANVGLEDGRANERSEMILHLLATRQDDAARALLARTEPMLAHRGLLYYRMGLVYADRGESVAAASFFGRAHEASPQDPDVRLSLGQALLASGRAQEAVAHLRAARDAGVSRAEAGRDLARALALLGRRTEALEAVGAAGGAEGATAELCLGLGTLAMGLDDPAAAIPVFERAVVLAPDRAAAHESLGLALGLVGRDQDAVAELEVAASLDARSATARFNLAVLHARQGRLDEARRRVDEALRLRPDYAQARDLSVRLEKTR